jgi:small-conductance mechanosensitive channel
MQSLRTQALRPSLWRLFAACVAALLLGGALTSAFAQTGPAATGPSGSATNPSQVASVIVDGRALFRVVGISLYPAAKRAAEIADRIDKLAEDLAFSVDDLRVRETDEGTEIFAGEQRVLLVVDADAQIEGVARKSLATAYAKQIKDAMRTHREERTAGRLTRSGLYTAAITAIFAIILWALRWLMPRTTGLLRARYRPKLDAIESKSFGMLDAEHFWSICEQSVRAGWWLVLAVIAYAYVDMALAQFPWTRYASHWLLNLVMDPLRIMAHGVAESVPGLAFIAVLAVLLRYLLMWLQLFFLGVGSGSVRIAGFEREWATPTFNALRIAVIALALVISYPYIPGSGTDAFKGISVLAGVLVSIGSSNMLGNVISGYVLIYQKAFHVGDRVMIGEHLGDVMQIKQQVTILRTVHSEEVVIPNSVVLGAQIVNYSATARTGGFIVYSSVTIGYDTPWRQVEAMLLAAAERTPGLLQEPKPFVLKRALEDFYVKYELNAYSRDASQLLQLYSALHQNILDQFNEHGVQIMSPHFFGQPERSVVVPKDQWFAAPARRPGDLSAPRETDAGRS